VTGGTHNSGFLLLNTSGVIMTRNILCIDLVLHGSWERCNDDRILNCNWKPNFSIDIGGSRSQILICFNLQSTNSTQQGALIAAKVRPEEICIYWYLCQMRNPPLQLSLWWSTPHPSQSSRSKPSPAPWQQTHSPVSAYWSAWQILMNFSSF
jgi:hypothetical protein